MTRTIVVTDEQVDAALTLIAIEGGPDKVTPLVRKIAEARPRDHHGVRREGIEPSAR